MKQYVVTVYYPKDSGLFPNTLIIWAHGRSEAESRAMLMSPKASFAICRD